MSLLNFIDKETKEKIEDTAVILLNKKRKNSRSCKKAFNEAFIYLSYFKIK